MLAFLIGLYIVQLVGVMSAMIVTAMDNFNDSIYKTKRMFFLSLVPMFPMGYGVYLFYKKLK